MSVQPTDDVPVDADESQGGWDEARAYCDRRALIEQAKGMLRFVYAWTRTQR